MQRTSIIQLNNRKIILCDLRGIEKEDILKVSQQTWTLFGSALLENEKASFLVDLTGVTIPPKIMDDIVSISEQYKQNIAKEGVIGLYGFKRTMLNIYGWSIGSNLKAFKDRELAFNWLAS